MAMKAKGFIMNVWKYFEIAKSIALVKKNRLDRDLRNFFFGTVALRRDNILVAASNGCVAIDNGSKQHYFSNAHSEFRIAKKLDKGAIVFVTRVNSDGSFRNAKPCPNCEMVLRKKMVKRVYYTISDNEYGVLKI
jgi:uncharacterized protein with PIN domain